MLSLKSVKSLQEPKCYLLTKQSHCGNQNAASQERRVTAGIKMLSLKDESHWGCQNAIIQSRKVQIKLKTIAKAWQNEYKKRMSSFPV